MLEYDIILYMDCIGKTVFDAKLYLHIIKNRKANAEEARRAVRNTLFGVVGRAQNKKNELKEEYE